MPSVQSMTPAQRAKRKYYLANREACIERTRVWRLENVEQARKNARKSASSEKSKQSRAAWKAANPERRREIALKYALSEKGMQKQKAWRASNPDRVKEISLAYQRSDKARQSRQEWYAENIEAINMQRRESRKSYTRQIFADQLRTLIRNSLRAHGSRKADKTENIVGCTIEFLRTHLESNFQAGMSWANRNLWHIDHKKPCAAFDLTDPEQQKACFHYTNLQPLWAVDNIRKGSRYGQDSCTPA